MTYEKVFEMGKKEIISHNASGINGRLAIQADIGGEGATASA